MIFKTKKDRKKDTIYNWKHLTKSDYKIRTATVSSESYTWIKVVPCEKEDQTH